MNYNRSPRLSTNSILGSLFVLSLIFSSSVSHAQAIANFSGVWIQDTIKSDDFFKSFEVKYTITQNLQTFKVIQSLTLKGSTETITSDYSYTLDGKVTTRVKEGNTEKNSAKWSADKKILTTRSIITYGNEDVGFTETYSLSNNGLVLTVLKSNIIPGVPEVKQVFNKKH
jgi:hypothetical protein